MQAHPHPPHIAINPIGELYGLSEDFGAAMKYSYRKGFGSDMESGLSLWGVFLYCLKKADRTEYEFYSLKLWNHLSLKEQLHFLVLRFFSF